MESDQKSNGAFVSSIIIIIILIVGGIYLFKKTPANAPTPQNGTEALLESDLNSTADLEAELEGIDLENLDSEI